MEAGRVGLYRAPAQFVMAMTAEDAYCLAGQLFAAAAAAEEMKRIATVTINGRYTRIKLAAAMFGLTEKAIRSKLARGVWLEGREYKRAPDGGIWIDLRGVEKWIEG
jgi:hypothetical protein